MNRLLKTKRLLGKYAKKFKGRFVPKVISRRQLNISCDEKLILALRVVAKSLESPVYCVAEHALQLGLSEMLYLSGDEAYKQDLQRHLLKHHLLVKDLDPLDERLSRRVIRLRNAIKYLQFFEVTTNPKEQREIISRFIKELAGGHK